VGGDTCWLQSALHPTCIRPPSRWCAGHSYHGLGSLSCLHFLPHSSCESEPGCSVAGSPLGSHQAELRCECSVFSEGLRRIDFQACSTRAIGRIHLVWFQGSGLQPLAPVGWSPAQPPNSVLKSQRTATVLHHMFPSMATVSWSTRRVPRACLPTRQCLTPCDGHKSHSLSPTL
jgi:hypothetical protein